MTGDEKFLLTLNIDGRNYPLKIKRSEEQAYRGAAHTIKNKLNQYRVAFGNQSGLTTQDFLTMIAIQTLVENFTLDDKNDMKPFENKINDLAKELDAYLKNSK